MKQERIWRLIARKLSGEITETEQYELDAHLKDNPQMSDCYEAIDYMWKNGNEETYANIRPVMKLLKRVKECTDDIY